MSRRLPNRFTLSSNVVYPIDTKIMANLKEIQYTFCGNDIIGYQYALFVEDEIAKDKDRGWFEFVVV